MQLKPLLKDLRGSIKELKGLPSHELQEDYMKAVRKLNDAKKLEGSLSYDSAFGDGGKSK